MGNSETLKKVRKHLMLMIDALKEEIFDYPSLMIDMLALKNTVDALADSTLPTPASTKEESYKLLIDFLSGLIKSDADVTMMFRLPTNVGKKPEPRSDSPSKPKDYEDCPDSMFADPVNFKYPLNTRERAQAAARYWGMKRNREKYDKEEQAFIEARIKTALEYYRRLEEDEGRKSTNAGSSDFRRIYA